MDRYKVKVERGVELLNAKGPRGWYRRLTLNKLDAGRGSRCVLGQVFGSFSDGKYSLDLSEGEAIACGFQAADLEGLPWSAEPWWVREDEQYTALTTVWRAAILELRRAQRWQ